jgi:hypothetical protein
VDREQVADPLSVGGQPEEVLGDRLVPIPPPGGVLDVDEAVS